MKTRKYGEEMGKEVEERDDVEEEEETPQKKRRGKQKRARRGRGRRWTKGVTRLKRGKGDKNRGRVGNKE